MDIEQLRVERDTTAGRLHQAHARSHDPLTLQKFALELAVLDHAIDLFTRLPLEVAVGHAQHCSAEPCPQFGAYGFTSGRVQQIVAATLTQALKVVRAEHERPVPHLRTGDGQPWTEAMTRAVFDPTAPERPTDWPRGIAVPPVRTDQLATAAIDAFLQLRDTHGLAEETARPQAVSTTLRREAERERDLQSPTTVEAYHHHHHHGVGPAQRQAPDAQPGAYYVSVIDRHRRDVLAGPWCDNHQAALDQVARAKSLTIKLHPMAAFYAFGTCRLDPQGKSLPVGKLNGRLGLVVGSDGYITAAAKDEIQVPVLRARDGQPWTEAMTRAAFDPAAADRPIDLPSNLAVPEERARSLVDDAIGLFLEYRDRYDHEEPAARAWAVTEVVDGEAAREQIEWPEAVHLHQGVARDSVVVRADPAIDTGEGLAVW